jgi:DUF1707 SHOCT-like domain
MDCGSARHPDPSTALQRERALRGLRTACEDGRLTAGEFAARADAVLQAATGQELGRVTEDLPGPAAGAVSGHRHPARRLLVGFLTQVRTGSWPFPALRRRVVAVAVLGEVVIDLCHTSVTSFETEITAVALAGEVRVIVPPGMRAEAAGGTVVLGYTVFRAGQPAPGALRPALRVTAFAVLGDVRVEAGDGTR